MVFFLVCILANSHSVSAPCGIGDEYKFLKRYVEIPLFNLEILLLQRSTSIMRSIGELTAVSLKFFQQLFSSLKFHLVFNDSKCLEVVARSGQL